MRISFFTASPFKDTKNRFNNVQKQDKCDKQNKYLRACFPLHRLPFHFLYGVISAYRP